MRIGVVINPISGARGHRASDASARETLARRQLERAGVEFEVVLTRARGHGAEIARDFVRRSFDRVIGWGGDGTINEVAGPLIGTSTALGIVASGSGDGYARGIGLCAPPERALETAISARVVPLDVGWFDGRHFLNVCGIGFDAAVATEFNRRRTRGALGYVKRGFALVWSYRPESYRITLDGAVFEGPRFLIAFGNGRQYGNGLAITPDANPADGWLDVVLVSGGTPLQQLWRGRRLVIGPRRPASGVYRTRVRSARVASNRLICHVDGETFESSGDVAIRLQPQALLVAGARV